MRIAVVGGGPKGLFAVERLLAHAGGSSLEVVVFDLVTPGRGAAYDPDQPSWLRLNVTSALVDAAWHTGPNPSAAWLLSLDGWRAASGEPLPLDPFPSRALVGTYLAWVWDGLLRTAPEGCAVHHRRRLAADVTPSGGGWLVDGEEFDEVLLACGHASDWPGALRHHWTGPEQLVDRAYPVAALTAVRPGAAVATRGAALTFIDVALALTEGRGGRFLPAGAERWPAYCAAGAEPRVIWPTSRSGRLPAVKPQPGSRLATFDRADVVATAGQRLRGAGSARAALAEVPALARTLLDLVDGAGCDDVDAVFAGAADHDPGAALARSWSVATGRGRPDATWAVGQAWRDAYPSLVARFSGTADAEAFAEFAMVAQRLEPQAFGPPPVNAAKLLALVEAGLVDPSSLGAAMAGPGGFTWRSGGPPADVVVDAVLSPPGAAPVPGSLPGRLLTAGVPSTVPGRRGLVIDDDGTCLSATGDRLAGLSAVGRPTEDVTIGNDTLSRTLHGTTERWAARVAGRLAVHR